MAAVKDKVVAVRMDHASGCLRFGEVAMESDAMRSQLTTLARQLFKVKYKKKGTTHAHKQEDTLAPHTHTNRETPKHPRTVGGPRQFLGCGDVATPSHSGRTWAIPRVGGRSDTAPRGRFAVLAPSLALGLVPAARCPGR